MSEYTMAVFGTLEQGEADFQRTYSSLQSEVSTLESQLRSSLSRWDGSAQQAYYQAQAQRIAAMANMAQVLSQLGAVIGTANSNYMNAESRNTALWSG
jgi:early secretory antigenic target protein ESAT-6